MRSVIFLDYNRKDRDYLTTDWEANFNINVISCTSEVEAIRQLEELSPMVKILIIKSTEHELIHVNRYLDKVPDTKLIIQKDITQYLNKIQNDLPSIFKITDLFEKSRVKELFNSLGIEKKNPKTDEGFCKVQLYSFFQFYYAVVNIHLKLGQGNFVRIINKGDLFTKEILEKYRGKKIRYLYLEKEDLPFFMEEMTKTLSDFYNKESLSLSIQKEVHLASLDNINASLKSIGLTESTIDLTNKTISAVIYSLSKIDRLWDYLQRKADSGSFFSEHSLAVSVLACAIAEETDWKTEYTFKKLVIASLLHDIGIEDEHLIYLRSNKDEGFKQLCSSKQKQYMEHPDKACIILNSFPELPANVDTIVMEHHERPSGDGFPRKLDSFNITPLSCVFIIAEEFYHLLHKGNYTIEARNKALAILPEIYSKGNFKNPLNSLLRLFHKGGK
jgi:HD-GYP domain-containing protein (c-di-GMP phosphodiesterase class II)